MLDKKQAFTGLTDHYNKARPGYPLEIYHQILNYWKQKNQSDFPEIVDVGCGTGISTRLFFDALHGRCEIIGVEPGMEMINKAIASSDNKIQYLLSCAEKISLPDYSQDIVTAAQAAQWFDRPAFYTETKRILRDSGVIGIYENNRDWKKSQFLEAHEIFLETYAVDPKAGKSYSRYYRDFNYAEELNRHFQDVCTYSMHWVRTMDSELFLKMAKSSTQVKKAEVAIGSERVLELLLKNINKHLDSNGMLTVPYETQLFLGRVKVR